MHAPEVHCATTHAVPVAGQSLGLVHIGAPELALLELELLELELLELELLVAAPAPPDPLLDALVPELVDAPPVSEVALPAAPLLDAWLLAPELDEAPQALHTAPTASIIHVWTDFISPVSLRTRDAGTAS